MHSRALFAILAVVATATVFVLGFLVGAAGKHVPAAGGSTPDIEGRLERQLDTLRGRIEGLTRRMEEVAVRGQPGGRGDLRAEVRPKPPAPAPEILARLDGLEEAIQKLARSPAVDHRLERARQMYPTPRDQQVREYIRAEEADPEAVRTRAGGGLVTMSRAEVVERLGSPSQIDRTGGGTLYWTYVTADGSGEVILWFVDGYVSRTSARFYR